MALRYCTTVWGNHCNDSDMSSLFKVCDSSRLYFILLKCKMQVCNTILCGSGHFFPIIVVLIACSESKYFIINLAKCIEIEILLADFVISETKQANIVIVFH